MLLYVISSMYKIMSCSRENLKISSILELTVGGVTRGGGGNALSMTRTRPWSMVKKFDYDY